MKRRVALGTAASAVAHWFFVPCSAWLAGSGCLFAAEHRIGSPASAPACTVGTSRPAEHRIRDGAAQGVPLQDVRTFEDIYGPSGESFQAALGFRVFEGESFAPAQTSYGVGVDDMLVQWREYKLIEDATDCTATGACASIVLDRGGIFGGEGVLRIRVLDSSPYGMTAPFDRNDCDGNGSYTDLVDDTDCDNNGVDDVTLTATSLAEPAGERVIANQASAGVYFAELPIAANINVPGVLYVQDAGPNGTEANVRYEDRWDGSASGSRCRNSSNPALQGFVTEGTDVNTLAGNIAIISTRLVEINGDLDGFPDTNETVDLYATVANKTMTPVTGVVVRISSSDSKIDCILRASSLIPSLDPRGGSGAIRETPVPFRLHVAAAADRGGTVPVAACVGGQCSNGAGSCVTTANCSKTVFDDYAARISVSIASDAFDVSTAPQQFVLDLDLNAATPVQATTTWVEGFESGFGQFTFQNLDANIASNSASNGSRCQYNDPDYFLSNSYHIPEPCYLGFAAGQSPVNDWHAHTTTAPDGGRAYLGSNSLHYGKHVPGNPGLDTYGLSQLDAFRTVAALKLAARVCQNDPAADKHSCNSAADCTGFGGGTCSSAAALLSFKQQISLTDSRSTNTPSGQAADRGVVSAQIVGASVWQKLYPYENVYDAQGTDNFSNCTFDPTDDGNTEDDYFDPTDPARRYGPSSTCFPEFTFVYLGDTDAPFAPSQIGRAGDGPGLPGSLGIGTWVESKFDLVRYRGRSIRLRFLITSIKVEDVTTLESVFMWNPTPADDGWYVDDVRVTQTLGASSPTMTGDLADNSGLPGCPAFPCSSLTPSLIVSPSGGIAPGAPSVLHAEGSIADACVNGAFLYRFFEDADVSGTFSLGDPVLAPFGTSATLTEAPIITTRYGVTVKCSAGGTGACGGGDATATYTLTCAPPPPVYDSSLWWTRVGWSGKTTIALPPFGEITDLVRGDLGLLRSSGTFLGSALVCLGDDQAARAIQDPTAPSAGAGYFYLLRGQRVCNDNSSFSTFSPRENPAFPGRRDAEITVCPP